MSNDLSRLTLYSFCSKTSVCFTDCFRLSGMTSNSRLEKLPNEIRESNCILFGVECLGVSAMKIGILIQNDLTLTFQN